MAVLTISNSIQLLSTSTTTQETAGEALLENDALFKVTNSGTGTVGTVKKLVNTSEETATFYGFALQASKSGGSVAVGAGTFEMDASTFAAGECYVASATAGKLQPVTDLGAADYFGVVGFSYEVDQFVSMPKYVGLVA